MNSDIDNSHRPTLRRGAGLVLIGLLAAVSFVALDRTGATADESDNDTTERSTAEVSVSDLSRSFDATGTLAYADQRTVTHPSDGIVTAIAEEGIEIQSGDVLYRVDEVPTVALLGDTPAWRTMQVDDSGPDVLQLETALVDLGYDPDGSLTVDGTYTSYTATLVAQWQADLGTDETGKVDHGAVVFVAPDTVVGTNLAAVGQSVPTEGVLRLRSPDRLVTLEVAIADVSTLEVGDILTAQLPDRSTFEIIVSDLSPFESGVWLMTAEPVDLSPGAVPADEAPVTASWSVPVKEGAVVVPAGALRRLDSGSYVVEVQTDVDETELVAVEIGEQSGSLVEIISPLTPGVTVVSP